MFGGREEWKKGKEEGQKKGRGGGRKGGENLRTCHKRSSHQQAARLTANSASRMPWNISKTNQARMLSISKSFYLLSGASPRC